MRPLQASMLRSASRASRASHTNITRFSPSLLQHPYSTSPPPPIDPVALHKVMLDRPTKHFYDHLTPTHTRLLTNSLSDFIPQDALPSLPTDLTLPAAFMWEDTLLPEGYHLFHFPLDVAPSLLAPDGTDPAHAPPKALGFTRRMWAGGSVNFQGRGAPLALNGEAVVCEESLADVRVKGTEGREKVFVDVRRRYGYAAEDGDGLEDGQAEVEEIRSLVFMRPAEIDPTGGKPKERRVVKAPHKPDASITLTPTPTLLFHFSALTYNAHSIHLDPQYCREVEGHRGLLVHGPLSFLLMMSVLRMELRKIGRERAILGVEYRNLAPLYAGEPLTACVRRNPSSEGEQDRWDVWIEGPDGGLAVKGVATTAAMR